MLVVFDGPRAKIDRANTHINGLHAEINKFLARNPYRIFVHDDAQAGRYSLRCEVRELVPTDLALILGDAIHNMRTALDILANDLIVFCTPTSKRNSSFPIFVDPKGAEAAIVKRMEGASATIVDCVKSLQPYNTGDKNLRGLHDLDIRDKHHLIIPVVTHPSFHGFTARQRGTGGTMRIGSVSPNPTKLGIQIFASWAKSMNFEYDDKVQSSFAITFGDSEPFPGQDLVSTLKLLSKETLNVVVKFETLCS